MDGARVVFQSAMSVTELCVDLQLTRTADDESADVYAFGVVLWELWTRAEPWSDKKPWELSAAVEAGERPDIPSDWCAFVCV